MDMDISKMSEMGFRVTIIKMMCRLEKNINESIETLRAEMRSNLVELKNDMNDIESKPDALTARVNEAEE